MLVNKSLILFNCDHGRRKKENSSLETSDKYTDVSLKLHYIFITAMWYDPQSNIWRGQALNINFLFVGGASIFAKFLS